MILSRRIPTLLSSLPSNPLQRVASHVHFSSKRSIVPRRFSPTLQHNKLFYVCLGTLAVAMYSTSTNKSESEADQRPKDLKGGNTNFKFKHGATMFPHPDKEYKGGEDAYFVSDNGLVIGVADGVGGWASKGVDPAIYARALMEGARKFVNSNSGIDPVAIMEAGYALAAAQLGSSTCCIVVLNGSNLDSANLGDSGFIVIRNNQIVFRTKEQQHRFNFPFQLGNHSKDKPQHSDRQKIQVQTGDVVIVGTDGLFDNLYDAEIVLCVAKTKSTNPQQISDAVAKMARECAEKRTGDSPFSEGSTKYGRPRQGGKMDDITVVVGVVA